MKRFIPMLTVCVILAACTSIISEEKIVDRTSFALGQPSSEFTISNRKNSAIKTTYTATTKKGKTYSCYVEGPLPVSDALCNEMSSGEPAAKGKSAAGKPAPKNCNELLKAAGRC